MSFVLDENVPASVLRALKGKDFEVVRLIDMGLARLKNSEVAELAIRESKIVITLDSDFLRLRRNLLSKVKVIFIDVHPRDPALIARLIDKFVNECIETLKRKNIVILTEEGASS